MDPKISLYISALSLLITVLTSLFFFNVFQKMKKTIGEIRCNITGLSSTVNALKKKPLEPRVVVETKHVDQEDVEEEDVEDEEEDDQEDVEDDDNESEVELDN